VHARPFLFTLLSIVICTFYFYAASRISAFFFSEDGEVFAENTYIATVDVSGKTKNEAILLLRRSWEEREIHIELSWSDEQVEIDGKLFFDLNVEESVNRSQSGELNSPIINVNSKELADKIVENFLSIKKENIDLAKLTSFLKEWAANWKNHTVNVDLTNFQLEDQNITVLNEVLAPSSFTTKGLQQLVEEHPTIEIKEHQIFSLLNWMEKERISYLSDNDLSVLGTYLYELILPTNFQIIERNRHQQLPEYAKIGYDVYVKGKDQYDFSFFNGNNVAYSIEWSMVQGNLYLVLTGYPFSHKYEIKVKDYQTFTPKTIVRYHPFVEDNKVKVIERGKNGEYAKVVRQTYTSKGELLNEETISEDYYPPIHRVELHPIDGETTSMTSESEQNDKNELESVYDNGETIIK
jgi:hypothetical protein